MDRIDKRKREKGRQRDEEKEEKDIYHNEDIIAISIVARVSRWVDRRRLIVDSITVRTGQESAKRSSAGKRVIYLLARARVGSR